jgi:hypothetical protein
MPNSRYVIPELSLYYYDQQRVGAIIDAIQQASLEQMATLGRAYRSGASVEQSRISIAAQLEISRSDARNVYSRASDAWMHASESFLSDHDEATRQNLVSSFPALLDMLSAVVLFGYLPEHAYAVLANPFETVFGELAV